jgi:hypothetical protein
MTFSAHVRTERALPLAFTSQIEPACYWQMHRQTGIDDAVLRDIITLSKDLEVRYPWDNGHNETSLATHQTIVTRFGLRVNSFFYFCWRVFCEVSTLNPVHRNDPVCTGNQNLYEDLALEGNAFPWATCKKVVSRFSYTYR